MKEKLGPNWIVVEHNEKRRATQRYDAWWLGCCRVGDNGALWHGTVVNVSLGGACLALTDGNGEIASGDTVSFYALLDSTHDVVTMTGRICWIRPDAQGRTQLGIQFDAPSVSFQKIAGWIQDRAA
jgi:hypothetical protein